MGQLHASLISAVVEKNRALPAGFRRRLTDWIQSADPSYVDEIKIPHRVPDCYRLSDGVLVVWEVEVTCVLTRERLSDWGWLWADLDASDLELVLDLRVVDKTGLEHTVDMVAVYYDVLRDRVGDWTTYRSLATVS